MRKGRDGGNVKKKKKTDDYSGHYVIASSQPPERANINLVGKSQMISSVPVVSIAIVHRTINYVSNY